MRIILLQYDGPMEQFYSFLKFFFFLLGFYEDSMKMALNVNAIFFFIRRDHRRIVLTLPARNRISSEPFSVDYLLPSPIPLRPTTMDSPFFFFSPLCSSVLCCSSPPRLARNDSK